MGLKKKKTTQSEAAAATESKTARRRRLWNDVRYGRALKLDFFKRNAWLMVAILVAILSLIGLRYKTKTKMQQIKKLQTELELARTEKLREKAEYMTLIRESEMRRLVTEKGLGLQFREQPPYRINTPDTTRHK